MEAWLGVRNVVWRRHSCRTEPIARTNVIGCPMHGAARGTIRILLGMVRLPDKIEHQSGIRTARLGGRSQWQALPDHRPSSVAMIAPSGMAHPTGAALLIAFPLCY